MVGDYGRMRISYHRTRARRCAARGGVMVAVQAPAVASVAWLQRETGAGVDDSDHHNPIDQRVKHLEQGDVMQIIINSDKNVEVTEDVENEISSIIRADLDRFESRLTRVEVHLSDASAGRSTGDDIHCQLEARPEGLQPESTSGTADIREDALRGALEKMISRLDTVFGKLDHRKGSTPMSGEATP